jgi:predicted HicB family RNase H-like nuclease
MRMAIARRPNINRKMAPAGEQELAAEAFIHGAAKAKAPATEGTRKTPIMLRFDVALLRRVDAAAKRRGISRSAWIAFKVSEALDADET